MKIAGKSLKSNKGFTLQDAAIAIGIILLFTGVVVGGFIKIANVQAETKLDAVATLFAVQAMERIDKVSYEEVEKDNLEELASQMKNDFSIPSSFDIKLDIIPDELTDQLVKTVQLDLSYTFQNETRNIVIRRLKVKEL